MDNNNINQIDSRLLKANSEYETIMRELKPEINNFLFSRLPGGLTLDEFEKISVNVYSIIIESWDKFI